jgi:hypothetical protein
MRARFTDIKIAIRNPTPVAFAGGWKPIFNAILEGSKDMVRPVAQTFLYLIDSPKTRKFVRPLLDIEVFISQFTDAYTSKNAISLDVLKICTVMIDEIINNWVGLHYFCTGKRQPIYSIIEALSFPNNELRVY